MQQHLFFLIHPRPTHTHSSPIILSEDRGSDSAAAARGASGFEFDVDPNVDPELALVLLISMEEERLRQEAAAKKAREESSKTENEGQSSTSNGDIVMADAEPEPNSYTEDKGLHCKVCFIAIQLMQSVSFVLDVQQLLEITHKKGLLRPPQLYLLGILPLTKVQVIRIYFLLCVVASMSVRLGRKDKCRSMASDILNICSTSL
jgi:hypothetical protein